jgi:hypothetical protein
VKAITLPLRTSGIFEMLDVACFSAFKGIEKHLSKDAQRKNLHGVIFLAPSGFYMPGPISQLPVGWSLLTIHSKENA